MLKDKSFGLPLWGWFMEIDSSKVQTSLSQDNFLDSLLSRGVAEREFSIDKEKDLKSLYSLAKIYYDKADLILAEECFKKALENTKEGRDIFLKFKILGFLIRIAFEQMKKDDVTSYITQSEELLEHTSKNLGSLSAEYFYNCGILKTYKSEHRESEKFLELALNKAKKENDYELQAKCLYALAKTKFHLIEYDEALDHLNFLTQLLAVINKSYLCGTMYLLTANLHLELERLDSAEKYFKLASEHLMAKKCWNLCGSVFLGRGKIHNKKGEFVRALLFFDLALETVDKTVFKRTTQIIEAEIEDVKDADVDIYLDKVNRKVVEKSVGTIDFRHRFVLLEILFLLAKNVGNYYDKEELAKLIWKDEYNPLIHDKLIYTSISRLRKLIEPPLSEESKRKYIVRGKDGYTFCSTAKIRFFSEDRVRVDRTLSDMEIGSPV